MPRAARRKSASGVYHVMVRGINRQSIFREEADKSIYLDLLAKYKEICGFELYAYCLMNNHVHLLLKEGHDELPKVMKMLGTSYAYRYNLKYNRIGHVFQDRYKSEAVENDTYLLTVFRYIHQNPVKTGQSIAKWTSYRDYTEAAKIADADLVLGLFNNDIAELDRFLKARNEDKCLDIEMSMRLSDERAKALVLSVGGVESCQALKELDKQRLRTVLSALKKKGLSVRQIERLTGINRGFVQRV